MPLLPPRDEVADTKEITGDWQRLARLFRFRAVNGLRHDSTFHAKRTVEPTHILPLER
jgi:hypothetical protein